jgi:GTP-binding protein YchF
MKLGIVGLPNVGKSTLFNALTQTQAAEAANYPFCTIEPNQGKVGVPDSRLATLAQLAGSQKIIPTQITFVDIAGLVKGASKGEGLGNQFLSHIREVDAIIHVVRCFENGDVTHVDGSVDPLRDIDTIETELMLSDLERAEKHQVKIAKLAKSGDKDAKEAEAVLSAVLVALGQGKPARTIPDDLKAHHFFHDLQMITGKPVLYVANVGEAEATTGNSHVTKVQHFATGQGSGVVMIAAAIESEIAQLPEDEKDVFLTELGLSESGLSRLIRASYDLLGLMTFFTVGPKEARAWTLRRGAKAPQAAGEIHTDFEKGFIRAETIAYNDYIVCKGEAAARDAGKLRTEGKEYVVHDGDVMHFLFNV